MDPGLGGELELGVRAAGQVRRQHVRLDPERRQVSRELQRALDTAPAAGREVTRHEQHFHGPNGTPSLKATNRLSA